MVNERKNNKDLTNLLVGLALGVSPIPVVGEIALSYAFNKVLKDG